MVSDDYGMLPSVSAKLIRRKVCEKNSVFCCVLAVKMLQDGKPTLIYAIVCKKNDLRRNKKKLLRRTKQCQTVITAISARATRAMPST